MLLGMEDGLCDTERDMKSAWLDGIMLEGREVQDPAAEATLGSRKQSSAKSHWQNYLC